MSAINAKAYRKMLEELQKMLGRVLTLKEIGNAQNGIWPKKEKKCE
jgi:hypothetical protein